jgi:hypothetical protein
MDSAPWLATGESQGRWVDAGELHVGDAVRQAGIVQAVVVVQRSQPTYNLTVAVAHTFFVGEQQWLVHNANNCDITKRPSGWRKSSGPEAMKKKAPIDADGDTICPACGRKTDYFSPDHYPTVAERRATGNYDTRKEWLDDYYNPDELRPICPSCNVSHRWENTPTDQLPYWPKE